MNKTKTILIVAPYFPPDSGGLERYALEIASRLQKDHGWRIVVVTSGTYRGKNKREEVGALTVYRLGYGIKLSNTPFSFRWIGRIRTILRNEKPDIINIHTPVPGIGDVTSMLASKTPVVITYHAGSMLKGNFFMDLIIWPYEKIVLQFMLRRAEHIICSSDFVRFNFLNKYLFKSSTITPGIDPEFFVPDPDKKSKYPTVLFVAKLGRAEKYKGLKTLIGAIGILRETIPDIRLVVIGDGNARHRYEDYVQKNNLLETISFKGNLGGEALVVEYQKAHVFALPTSNDSHPTVLLEAMACELPVVSTTVGGIPAMVENEKTGFLISPKNSLLLAQKIKELFENPDLCASFSAAGRKKACKEFGWQRRLKQYDHILGQALGKNMDHPTRITVVSPYFYPKIGGLENYAYNVAKRLHQSGEYEVSVITSNHESKEYRQDMIDGMRIHRLPIWKKVSNTPINFSWHRWIKKIISAEKPDIIHAHAPVPYMADIAAALTKDTPLVLTYHSGSMLKGKWPIDILIIIYEWIFLRSLFNAADVVVGVSQNFIQSEWGKTFVHKLRFIRPGVDTEQYVPTPLPVDSKIVTFVGRVEQNSSWKGIEQLLQAMVLVIKKIPDAKLEIVGGGDAVQYYKMRADKLGIGDSVTMCETQTGKELISAYQRSSVVVLPSVSKAEQSSIALIEAMASGRPVIGTEIGGTPQIIDHENNGLLVRPKDQKALSEAIERILTDRAFAVRLAENGAFSAKQVDWSIQIKKYQKLFEKLLERKPTIAQVAAYYPPHIGGIERVAKMASEELAKKEYPVCVFASDRGIGRHDFRTAANPSIKFMKSFEFAHTPLAPALFWHLLRLPKNSIIHLHLAQAYYPEVVWLASGLRKIPYVVHFHLDVEPSGRLGPLFLFYKRLFWKTILKSADKVVVCSQAQAELIRSKFDVKEENIEVVPNGVSNDFFSDKIYSLPNEKFRLLFVGRLTVQKRVDRLIEAMAKISVPAELTIVGDGEQRADLEALTDRLRLKNVFFEGNKNDSEMQEYHRNHDALLISSDKEGGTVLVALEAMASGLPIIGTNVIGVREMLSDVGILIKEPFVENFSSAIESLWKNPRRLKELSRKSRKKAGEYSWGKFSSRLETIYKKIPR